MFNRIKAFAADLFRCVNPGNNRVDYRRYGYDKAVDATQISVFKPRRGRKPIVAVLDDVWVRASLSRNPHSFVLYPDSSHPSIKYRIKLKKRTFPDLLPHSRIANIVLLKYMRQVAEHTRVKSWRLVVFTEQGQVYHNFPAEKPEMDGRFNRFDIVRFEESVVWDCEGRRFPSKEMQHQAYEQYVPNLPEECYQHHPPVRENGFSDHKTVTRNGKVVVLSRFYFPSRSKNTNPFVYMGGFANDYQMTVIGTYQGNIEVGARECVFFSSDGGREWYNRYEFGDPGEYDYVHKQRGYRISNWGNPVLIPGLNQSKNNAITDLRCTKRRINTAFDQQTKFIWEPFVEIEKVYCDKTLTVKTVQKHQYADGDVVSIVGKCNAEELEWAISETVDEASCLHTKLFKAKVLDDYTFELYEYVANPDNNICCRHIHHINRQKDGWIIGTGEVYPNGWIVFIQQKECDYFNRNSCNASADFNIYRLTSSPDCVQRTIGLEFLDDERIVFASDHPTLARPEQTIGDAEISRSSTGVYIGDARAIDDFSKYKCVYGSPEVGYFFRKIDGVLVYGGQLGELAFSFDDGQTWKTYHMNQTLRCYMGSFADGFIIDGIVFKRK